MSALEQDSERADIRSERSHEDEANGAEGIYRFPAYKASLDDLHLKTAALRKDFR
jgi:hypothetical protein